MQSLHCTYLALSQIRIHVVRNEFFSKPQAVQKPPAKHLHFTTF